MHSLTVWTPRIIIITLLRVKPRATKSLPWKGTKENVDMSELGWLCLCLLMVAETARNGLSEMQYGCRIHGLSLYSPDFRAEGSLQYARSL